MSSAAQDTCPTAIQDPRPDPQYEGTTGELVAAVEFLEMMYTLRKSGYEGWTSFDVFPYREDPAKVVFESIKFTLGLDALLDRIGMETIAEALEGDGPLAVLSLVRKEVLPG